MHVIRKIGSISVTGPEYPPPVPPIEIGTVIQVKQPMITLGGESYSVGDTLEVVGKTNEAPHNYRTSEGNLLVRGKDGRVTVWTCIEWCLADGEMEIVR